jgi:hypothetical protein
MSEQLLDEIRQRERKRHNRYLEAERELSQSKARVDELERLLQRAKVPPTSSGSEDDGTATRRRPAGELSLSEARYVDYLEKLADQKTAEADQLMSRLLRHRRAEVAARQQLEGAKALRARNADLAAENRRLKGELDKHREQVAEYVVRHREAKADQRTRELQELAALRKHAETHKAELYAFVLSQLGQFVDGQCDLGEKSVRRIVARAAVLKSAAASPK